MRNDDDSWDIETSVGATALGVAAMRAAESRRPDALYHDPYAEPLVLAVGSAAWRRLVRGEFEGAEDFVGQSYNPISSFMHARTCYFDAYFAAAVQAGIRQFVILAAGLDARAYRLEWPTGTVIFELDQPKVLEFKAAALAEYPPAADRRAVPVDLRHDWPAALRDNGFDPAVPTAWLIEGLLRYLPADAQDRLFENMVALSAPGSRVALNMSRQRSPLAERKDRERAGMMAALGIKLDIDNLWYPYEGRSEPVEWFNRHGWQAAAADPVQVLADRGRSLPADAAEEMSRHILMTAIQPGGDSTP